jgi:hypothetical protein
MASDRYILPGRLGHQLGDAVGLAEGTPIGARDVLDDGAGLELVEGAIWPTLLAPYFWRRT